MLERCLRYRQYHTGTCGTPQVCFQCGQTGHVKRFCLMVSGISSVGQSSTQPRAPVQSFCRMMVRPSVSFRSETGSFGTQENQRP